MTISLYQAKKYGDLLNYYEQNHLEIPENHLPYYYRILCMSSLKLKRLKEGEYFLQQLVETNTGPSGEHFLKQEEIESLKTKLKSIGK